MQIGSLSRNKESDILEPSIDGYNRRIDYLRLSITDRCNLRCVYCTPGEGARRLYHEDILRYEEILRLVGLAGRLGITKVRITGGEPLVRRDALYLCEKIARLPSIKTVSITTNGILLSQLAEDLFKTGVNRLNISLDTLNPEKYAAITRNNLFHRVWEGIERACALGFYPIKLNVVVLRGINDDEIEDLAALTYSHPFHVRFIELMPFELQAQAGRFFSAEEVLRRLKKMDTIVPSISVNSNGPARYYRFPAGIGKIGLISPISNHFCSSCNRLRVTADGKLRTCLFAPNAVDLKALIRHGESNDTILGSIREAIKQKPMRHSLDGKGSSECVSGAMWGIGG